jgi:hypothetical protein
MFKCERCGSRFNAMHAAAIEHCPRCRIRDGIEAPLSFSPLEIPEGMRSRPRVRRVPSKAPLEPPRSLPLASTADLSDATERAREAAQSLEAEAT